MYEFRASLDGLVYYDPVQRKRKSVPNTILFLMGYSAVFGDDVVSDHLFLRNSVLDSDGRLVALTNQDFLSSAYSYLTDFDVVESRETGFTFPLYGLTLVLSPVGLKYFYKSTSTYVSYLDRVPHVPLITKRSQDYRRVYEILTQKKYWSDDPDPDKGAKALYSVFNPLGGDSAEALDLYHSFGSLDALKVLYEGTGIGIKEYPDYCSWFVWSSLSLTSLYQFSLGVLYGMSVLGYGLLPFQMRPTRYAQDFKYLTLVDEAYFWFVNTPLEVVGKNDLLNMMPNLYRTTREVSSLRLLSSTLDQSILEDTRNHTYSVDRGVTWITKNELHVWAIEHGDALPVTGYASLYQGNTSINLPLSDWEW